MPTFKRCNPTVQEMADSLIDEFETHAPLKVRKIRIDLMFAFPDYDERTGNPINDALTHNGVKALGITRKLPLKDRAKGLGDAEICLDGAWWEKNDEEEQRALLDHELHHIAVTEKNDAIGRPIIKLRKHDVQFGWFNIIAHRHGKHSQERIQACSLIDVYGQFYWPELASQNSGSRFSKLESSVITE